MMQITDEPAVGREGVTILGLDGELDASNFQDLIGEVRTLVAGGTRKIIVDLSGLSYMASSGLVALHSAALLLRGIEPPDPEEGWGAFHSMALEVGSGEHDPNIALVAPQPPVERVLERTGLKDFFPIHRDRADALAAL